MNLQFFISYSRADGIDFAKGLKISIDENFPDAKTFLDLIDAKGGRMGF